MNKNTYEDEYRLFIKKLNKMYGKNETIGYTVQKLARQFIGDKFIGVYSVDKIPRIGYGKCCIVNLDKHDEPGSHWIALARQGDYIMLFDSFGRSLNKINKHIKKKNDRIEVITPERDPEQKESETNCANHCIAFLIIWNRYGMKGAKYI